MVTMLTLGGDEPEILHMPAEKPAESACGVAVKAFTKVVDGYAYVKTVKQADDVFAALLSKHLYVSGGAYAVEKTGRYVLLNCKTKDVPGIKINGLRLEYLLNTKECGENTAALKDALHTFTVYAPVSNWGRAKHPWRRTPA